MIEDSSGDNEMLQVHRSFAEIEMVFDLRIGQPAEDRVPEPGAPAFSHESHPRLSYLDSENWIESDDHRLHYFAESITDDIEGEMAKARSIVEWMTNNLDRAPLEWTGNIESFREAYGAVGTLERGGGTCQNWALLYAALCRAIGIPTRLLHGLNSVPLDREVRIEEVSHAWAESYFEGVGWVPVDPIMNQFGEMTSRRIVLGVGSNNVFDIEDNLDRQWYYEDGMLSFIGYPVPYSDVRIAVTAIE